jgi:hypothetical protein
MTVPGTRVTLSNAHRDTAEGKELIALLLDLAEDGMVSREEMERLRAWLEVDRGIDFPACGFLFEIVEQISADGEITEEELDRLALGIERVLPKDVRSTAREQRRNRREQRRREQMASRAAARAERDADRARKRAEQERRRPLHRGDYLIAGACRSEERRDACERLSVGESVTLEREPDNRHDPNAILILSEGGDELGYIPREYARVMAPLLDAGAEPEATVQKLWDRRDGGVVPIVVSVLRGGDGPAPGRGPTKQPPTGGGCLSGCLTLILIGFAIMVLLAVLGAMAA